MKNKLFYISFALIIALLLSSCRRKCPIPSCHTRKYHQHALVFDMDALRKQERKRKMNKVRNFFGMEPKPITADSSEMVSDSTSVANEDVLEEEAGDEISEEPVEEEPKRKWWQKKKSKEEQEREKDMEELSTSEDEFSEPDKKKKKFKFPWQKSEEEKYLEEETQELEEGGDDTELEEVKGAEEEDFAKEWRSRKWPFWGKQRPKVGQRWKPPKKK